MNWSRCINRYIDLTGQVQRYIHIYMKQNRSTQNFKTALSLPLILLIFELSILVVSAGLILGARQMPQNKFGDISAFVLYYLPAAGAGLVTSLWVMANKKYERKLEAWLALTTVVLVVVMFFGFILF